MYLPIFLFITWSEFEAIWCTGTQILLTDFIIAVIHISATFLTNSSSLFPLLPPTVFQPLRSLPSSPYVFITMHSSFRGDFWAQGWAEQWQKRSQEGSGEESNCQYDCWKGCQVRKNGGGWISITSPNCLPYVSCNVIVENLESHQLTAASAEGKIYFLSDLILFRLLSSCSEAFSWKELPCICTPYLHVHVVIALWTTIFSFLVPCFLMLWTVCKLITWSWRS